MTDQHICAVCGHLDGDHGDGYCTKASGACFCLAFQPPFQAPPSTDPQETTMTDHATYLNQLLLSPTITYEERFQIRNTLAVVDAVRGLAPNTAQEATGCPQIDQQPEPGQVDGGKATEAGGFSDCPRCDRHLRAVQHFKSRAEKAEAQLESSRRGGVVLSAADYTALVARAERAEAERDAILGELRNIEVALSQRCAHSIGQTREAHHRAWDDVTGLLDRHTPEG